MGRTHNKFAMNSRQTATGSHGKRFQARSYGLEELLLDQRELKNLRRTVDLEIHRIVSRPGEQLALLELQEVVLLSVILDVHHPEGHAARDADVTFLLEGEAGVTASRVIEDFQNVRHVRHDEFRALTPGDVARAAQAGRRIERVFAFDSVAEQGHVATRIGKDGVLQIPGARGENEIAFEENGLFVLNERFAFLAAPFTNQVGVRKAILLRENLEGAAQNNCACDDANGGDDDFFHGGLLLRQYKPISRRSTRGPVIVEF